MANRNLSLSPRVENVRNEQPIASPIHFSAEEIKEHFVGTMQNIKDQFDVAQNLLQNGHTEECKMIWRSQIVLAEGLMDFFLHEVSKYCMFKMFCGDWPKSKKYQSFLVPISGVEKARDSLNPNEWFFEYLNDRFSRDVFLSAESMKDQLNLIGVDFSTVMVKAFPRSKRDASIEEGRKIIRSLFERRNEVVHQYDRSHATAEQTDISREFVETYIDEIEHIVNAVNDVIAEKDSAAG